MENNRPLSQQQGTQDNENAISIRDLVFIVLNNWYWFVISAVVCLIVSAFLYKSKPKAFTDNATILMRDDKGGKGKAWSGTKPGFWDYHHDLCSKGGVKVDYR